MATFRVEHNSNYTVMSNTHLKEKDMSLKAKGLLSLMLSLPDSWDYSIAGLCSICKENETAIKGALKELQDFGYVRIDKIMPSKENGGRIEYVYNVFERPTQKQDVEKQDIEKQALENLGVENQPLENHVQLSTKESNTKEVNKKESKRNKKEKILDEILGKFELYGFSETVQERLLDFYSDRIDNKEVPRDNQLTATLDMLAGVSEKVQLQAIENSIRGGWKTIYLPNSNNSNKQSYMTGAGSESYQEQKQRVDDLKHNTQLFKF